MQTIENRVRTHDWIRCVQSQIFVSEGGTLYAQTFGLRGLRDAGGRLEWCCVGEVHEAEQQRLCGRHADVLTRPIQRERGHHFTLAVLSIAFSLDEKLEDLCLRDDIFVDDSVLSSTERCFFLDLKPRWLS